MLTPEDAATLERMSEAIAHSGDLLQDFNGNRTKKGRVQAQETMHAVNEGRRVLRKLGLCDAIDREFLAACNKIPDETRRAFEAFETAMREVTKA